MSAFKVGDIVLIKSEQKKGVVTSNNLNGLGVYSVDKTMVGLRETSASYTTDDLELDTPVEVINELTDIIDPPDSKIMADWLDSLRDES